MCGDAKLEIPPGSETNLNFRYFKSIKEFQAQAIAPASFQTISKIK